MKANDNFSDDFAQVKEPRHSENISDEMCYLYRSTRHLKEAFLLDIGALFFLSGSDFRYLARVPIFIETFPVRLYIGFIVHVYTKHYK